jgi:GrpB-like predicted nucleotidyltransferase (UPF0157 family)
MPHACSNVAQIIDVMAIPERRVRVTLSGTSVASARTLAWATSPDPDRQYVRVGDESSDPILARSREVLVGGPDESVRILLVKYDETWPQRFAFEKLRIEGALGRQALSVEHIGSTSVPGLAAKPIIDICVVVEDSSDEPSFVPDLEDAGYELRAREPDWHGHRMLRIAAHDVHVHVFTLGSSEIDRYLSFRDWLRSNEADRELYASTKSALAEREWPTMQHYAEAKTDVVEAILARALRT